MEREQFHTYLQDPNRLNAGSLEEIKNITLEFPWFQTGWMLYLMNLKNVNSPDYHSVLKKVAIMVPERKNLFKYLNGELPKRQPGIEKLRVASGLYRLVGTGDEMGKNHLIDRFLSSDPGMIRNSGEAIEFKTDKAFLEKSLAESDDLITETLASIYFQQKKYEKAQKAYQKLSLKYPEKSVYFAARIKEIEVLKNNN
jgi:tetratricopeptide (TPR) repeat protein